MKTHKPTYLSWNTLEDYVSVYGRLTMEVLYGRSYFLVHVIMQILAGDSYLVSTCWRAHSFRIALGLNDKIEEGVEFAVHHDRFEGTVRIVYVQGGDLFRVDIGHLGQICYTQEHIHRDKVVDTIEEYFGMCKRV